MKELCVVTKRYFQKFYKLFSLSTTEMSSFHKIISKTFCQNAFTVRQNAALYSFHTHMHLIFIKFCRNNAHVLHSIIYHVKS